MENVKIFLTSGLNLIIGKDCKKEIKDAVRINSSMQGTTLASLFLSITEKAYFGIDIKKNRINIICSKEPKKEIVHAYYIFIEGKPIQQNKIVVPKGNLN